MEVVGRGGAAYVDEELRVEESEDEVLPCDWLTILRRSSAAFFAPFGVIGGRATPDPP